MQLSRIGPIALEEPLGGEADSNVLRGVHVERNKAMAVKLLPRRLVNRPMGGDTFAEDVKRLQRLTHPNIARVLGGAMDNGQPYLVMELVKGESLRSFFDRRGRLPWETMADIAEAICQALEYSHGEGLVHRRLTPARVLVTDEGGVKVVGFDCALADHDEVAALKSPMNVMNYLAPQEIRAKRSVGLPSNDLFSLGVMLYEGLAGELPWQARTPAELVMARQAARRPRVSAKVLECPVWLDVLVARLLEVKREGRLPSADAARRAILDAKSKVAAGMGAVQHAWSGKQGALASAVDRKELSRLRKAANVRVEKDDSPFYERAWFLGLCLAAIVGIGAWVMWPLGEEALFAKALSYMESEEPEDWRAATPYLDEIRERFPDTKHAKAIEEFNERLAMHGVMQRMRNLELTGRDPASEIERRFYEAWRQERLGYHFTAWQKYKALAGVFADSADRDDRRYVDAALARIRRLEESADLQQAPADIVRDQLDRAAELADEGKLLAARLVLDSVIELYDGHPELASLVDEAREQLKTLETPPPPEGAE